MGYKSKEDTPGRILVKVEVDVGSTHVAKMLPQILDLA